MNINELFDEIVVDPSYDSDYTLEDAELLIKDAKARGFGIPDKLTPELYIKMYNSHKTIRSQEYIMDICEERAVNCLTDFGSIDDVKNYLTDLKLAGYTVPAMLTPELFMELYNKANEEEGE